MAVPALTVHSLALVWEYPKRQASRRASLATLKHNPATARGAAFRRAKAYAEVRCMSTRKGHMSRTEATLIGGSPRNQRGMVSTVRPVKSCAPEKVQVWIRQSPVRIHCVLAVVGVWLQSTHPV